MASTKQDKIKLLNKLAKEDNIHTLLDELLPNMGFQDVNITHQRGSRPEDGKDLICSKLDEIEQKKDWYAFVVKKGAVAGTSSIIDEIRCQTRDCFKYEYTSLKTTTERVRINKVKVVTNFHFSSGAQDKILKDPDIEKANVDFWDADKLVDFLDKYYPSYWDKGSASYKKYVQIFSDKIKDDDFTKRLNLNNNKIQQLIELTMTPALLEKEETQDGQIVYKRKAVNSVLSVHKNTFIIGEPGSGKSTLFRILSREIIEQNSIRNDVEFYPIIVTFNQIKDNNYSLEETLNSYFASENYKLLGIDASLIIRGNKCVIFVDALDEIASNTEKENALNCIKCFSESNPKIKIICTSRPSDFIQEQCSAKNNFRALELDNLNRREVEQYINNYFGDNITKSKRLIKSLRDTGLLDRLPKTPLTVALITIIFDEQDIEIPSTITDLYSLFVDLLLKKLEIKDTYNIMEANIKMRILSFLAKQMHFNKQVSIPNIDALSYIKEYLTSRGLNQDKTQEILEDIISNSGLLYLNDKDEVQFKHLSFQEFFTAYELFNHRQAERNIFIDNFNKIWWQNVALFYAGFSKDAPLLLVDIIEKSEPNTFEEMINNIAGLGRLMQSLYSTPISARNTGIERTVETSTKAIEFLIRTDEPKYQFFKNFSKYGIYQIFGGWFNIHHHSITLVEPLKITFNNLLEQYVEGNYNDQSMIIEKEYQLFILASVLGNSSFFDFEPYRKFLEVTKSTDLSFIALQDMWFRESYKELTKSQKDDDNVAKVKKVMQNRMRKLGSIANTVNLSLMQIAEKSERENNDVEK